MRNRAENEQLQKMARGDRVWIGLSGTDWAWSDGAQPSFTPWRPRGPSAAGALGDCAVLVLDSKPLAMSDGDCAEKLPFFCYNGKQWFFFSHFLLFYIKFIRLPLILCPDPMRKVLLRLELSADPYADMRAPDVMDSIMKWVTYTVEGFLAACVDS